MVGVIDRIRLREWREEEERPQKGMVMEELGSARALIEVNVIGAGKDMMILKMSWSTKIGTLIETIWQCPNLEHAECHRVAET